MSSGKRKPKHVHNWVKTREKKVRKDIYIVWTCTNPGCPKGIKIEVYPSGDK